MDYQFTATQTETYLHVTGGGSHTEANLRRFLIDAHREGVERQCDSLLLELKFAGPSLHMGGIYAIVAERSADGAKFKRIAYVDNIAEHIPERAEFAELAANNRGVNVRLFRGLADAELWLRNAASPRST